MKKYWDAFVMCQSMFCSIPCPWKNWNEKARHLMLLFLPIVGIEIGAIWAVLACLTAALSLPVLLAGALICLYPFFITGFIHLDGFMDVTDAVKSWRDLERRREILKDSRVGAFAVIACAALMIMQFAAGATAAGDLINGQIALRTVTVCLMLIPVVSRCCSGLALSVLPVMDSSQYAGDRGKFNAAVFVVLMIVSVIAAFVLADKYGFAVLGCIAGYFLALLRAFRSLQGANGDVAGYALTIGEMCGLIVMALI